MLAGLILDNCPIGQSPPQTSYWKLQTMQARCIGTLWTGGTQHRADVYAECEARLQQPTYIVRVGGHRQTYHQWFDWAMAALDEIPDQVLAEERVRLACGNEGNLEGWADDPAGYGQLYAAVKAWSVPVLFACPSLGVPGWEDWLQAAYAPAQAERLIVNLYDHNVAQITKFVGPGREVWVGEVNRLGMPRTDWLNGAMQVLEDAGVAGALVFIAGGRSDGAWDERYIVSEQECGALRGEYEGGAMAWDRHAVYDAWAKSMGGQGANLGDAFGQAIEQGIVQDVGCFTSGYKGYGDEGCPYIYVYTTNGVLYVPKAGTSAANVKLARREADLPKA